MSFKAQFKVYGDPKFYDNGIRLATREEAQAYGQDKFNNWTCAEAFRVGEDLEPINFRFTDRGLEAIKEIKGY